MKTFKRKFNQSPGQALVEFALVITAVLMMIFLIIESARILWAWNTVQHAAREGARYAITGQFDTDPADPENCVVDFGQAKFRQPGRNVCDDLRVASIIYEAHDALSGLPLNETSNIFEDDEYYNIEVWGVNAQGQIQQDFGGIPDNPVIVRVYYQVPIITPFFRPIRETIIVFGQEVLNNESFGQLGTNQGSALPPNLPPLPTPGVTPSPTPTPLVTDTPTPNATNTPTPSPTPSCGVQFEGYVIEGDNAINVTGEVNTVVTIYNFSTNPNTPITSGTLLDRDGHACPGFASLAVDPALFSATDVLVAISSDLSTDSTIVLGAPPTNTPTPSPTQFPTLTPSPTLTPIPTSTPNTPYIVLFPSCGTPQQNPGSVTFNVSFINWPTNQSLTLRWEGTALIVWQPGQHAGTFVQPVSRVLPQVNADYTVTAQAGGGHTNSKTFTVPCGLGFPTPTPGTTPTSTPEPPDLIVIGPPQLISTPPIIAYQPVQFAVPITNAGGIPVNTQFFVDIYLDPTGVMTTTIPITESNGYSAVSSLAGGASRVITITAPFGFENVPTPHAVYSFVDSLEEIAEFREDNNISQPPLYVQVTPAATPTPSPTPGGADQISGGAMTLGDDLILQHRARIYLIDDSTGSVVQYTESDINGYYIFYNVPAPTSTYTVAGCITIDGEDWYRAVPGIVPPNNTAHVIMLRTPCVIP